MATAAAERAEGGAQGRGGGGKGGGVALPLITVENDIQFHVHEETIAFLKKQTHPIGVVGVAGLYRTGKSYLLNLLTGNSSSGFAVGSTINACTKGESQSLLSSRLSGIVRRNLDLE